MEVLRWDLTKGDPIRDTLPETNKSPLKMMVSNAGISFSRVYFFRGELLVLGRVPGSSFCVSKLCLLH